MQIGTKSLLFGAHQFIIHPLFVALAWWRLYGFPWDPRLWFAFFLHDIGYWGRPNIDGPEGRTHPVLGATIMGWLFDRGYRQFARTYPYHLTWYCFCFYHSRAMVDVYGYPPSGLCMADKLATTLEPWWLYLPRAVLTGEIKEYMGNYWRKRAWFYDLTSELRRWVKENHHDNTNVRNRPPTRPMHKMR